MSKQISQLIVFITLLWLQNAFAANSPPVLDAIATPQTVVLGNTLSFTVTANDPDGDTLTFSLENEPSGATIDANSGEFSWTPTAKGIFSVTVKVTDDRSPNLSDEQAISLFVSAIRPDFNTTNFPANDDSSVLANLGFTLNYFGNNYSDVYVNNNGNFTFGNSLSTYSASELSSAGLKIIAAFWADLDTRGNGSGIVQYGTSTVNGRSAFGATWIDVGYYSSQVDKLNSFQIILVDRSDIQAGDFDIELNYSKVQWESGSSNGGTNGLGGNSAHVGYSDGASINFELPGSGVNGALIDGGANALSSNSKDSEVVGRYYFPVRNGEIINPTITDLQITQSDSPDPVYTGNQITYSLTAKNLGPNEATNVKVVDTLPSGTTFISASGTDWTCNESNGTVTCNLANLAVATANPITINVTAPNTVGEISNQIQISSDISDSETSNNNYTEITTISLLKANLSITQSESNDPILTNANFSYTLTVKNAGPNEATNVKVVDTLPSGTTFISASGTDWTCNESNGTVTCNLANLAVATANPIAINVTAPRKDDNITNQVEISSDISDPDTTDNSASEITNIYLLKANLSITQSDSIDPIFTNRNFSYTINIKNAGPDEATNVKVVDTLPNGTTFISASGTDWTCNESNGTVTCNLPSLTVATANPITINVTAPNTVGEISNQVQISSDINDPDATNNGITEKTTIKFLYIPPPVQQQPEEPEKVNNPPTLENISNQTLKLGDSLQIQLNASDPDGNILSFSLSDAPNGASINDRVLTWKADKAGVFNFTVRVTDNGEPAKSDQKTFEVTVTEAIIKLETIPDKTIEFGETLEVTLSATTDQDDNNFTFSLVDSPDGAVINDGVLTWKADKVGVIKFTVKVTNNGNSDEQTFEVTVTEVKFNLTTLISPINGGSIQINPNKTSYDLDEEVKLTATVKDSECYEFSHWQGDCSGSECSLIMDADKTVTAHFIGKPVKLNITAKNGKVEPEKSEYLCGEQVELTATPNANYQFLGWTGYVSTNKNPISLVLKEQENNLTAIFGPTTNLRITPSQVHAKVGDELTFTASGSSNGNYFWGNADGETFKYKVTEQGIFYIWVTDGNGFAWSLVDSRSLDNAIILIRFAATNLNLSVGEKQQIAVKAYDGKANAKNIIGDVVLESKNPEIAQVMQNGQVTARGVGTTNLIATYQDKQAKLPVTVTAATRILQVKPENIILAEGDSQKVKIYDINQSGTKSLFKDAILNIRNTQIALVKNDVVTGVSKGSTWLDIVSGELSLSVPVIVRFRQKLAISPSKTTIIKGNRVLFLISGGKPPYQIKATNGQILKGASNSRFVYQSDSTGTAKVRIIDSLNAEVTARININSALDVTPQIARLTSKETVTLQAIGGDDNYFWTATKGQLSSLTDRRVEYTAPAKTGRYTVTVRDGLGNTKDILVLVGEELLLSQQQLFLEPEQNIELNILAGESPYTVEIDAGNVEIIDSKIHYKAPKVSGNYTLTVNDNKNHKVTAEIKVALDLLITPLSSRIDAGDNLTLHAAGGFGNKRWVASKGKLDKTDGETVIWTAPNNFGPAIIYVMDAAGAIAIANLEVASKGFAVTPSVRHVLPNDNADFTAVGGATPYTWIVEQGDFNAVEDETINYQAGNVRGSYKIEITDNSGKKAQAQVNVYSTRLFASPKILYINKGETLPISIGGGTGNYTVTSQLGKLTDNQLKLKDDQRSIKTKYTAPQDFEGNDTINIFDTAGNLVSIKVEIAKKDDIIAIYAGTDGKVDEAEMSLAIDDFFAGQAWLDRTIMFEIAEQFVGE